MGQDEQDPLAFIGTTAANPPMQTAAQVLVDLRRMIDTLGPPLPRGVAIPFPLTSPPYAGPERFRWTAVRDSRSSTAAHPLLTSWDMGKGQDRAVRTTIVNGRIHTEDLPGSLAPGARWPRLRMAPAAAPRGWRAQLLGLLVSLHLLGGR